MDNHDRVWKVFLPSGKDVIIHAHWVKVLGGRIIFGYGDRTDLHTEVGVFWEGQICGYTLVGGSFMYIEEH